jgi:hypothetical protein
MRKLLRALAFLLTILTVTIPVDAGDQVATHQDVVAKARSSYYSLTKKGFKDFTGTIEPNWKVILADTANRENLKIFRSIRFSIVVNAEGVVTVSYEVGADAAKPALQPFVKRIHSDLQRLVAGFFNTWRMFTLSSPFPTKENLIKVENLSNQYRFTGNMSSGVVVISMTGDFAITEWNLSGPTAKRMIKPRFEKTGAGFLLTGYESFFDPIGEGIGTELNFDIEYQDVNGFKIPHKVRLSGVHGTEPVESELVFRVNGQQ